MDLRQATLGRPAPEVAREPLVTERRVRNRAARYHAEGAAGVVDRPKSGCPGRLAPAREARLKDRLRADGGRSSPPGGMPANRPPGFPRPTPRTRTDRRRLALPEAGGRRFQATEDIGNPSEVHWTRRSPAERRA